MATTVARLEAFLGADTRQFDQAMDKSHHRLTSIGKAAAVTAGAAGLGALFATLKVGIPEWVEQTKVAAQTNAVIKSTGKAANVTLKHVDKLAGAISNYSGMDDEAVQSGENMLLTFSQIQNRVGKTNDIFDQATKATADLSVAMGIDMSKAALQVGKALNDPERGYARLQRIGVAFTESQINAIKAMQKMGNTAGAQKVILKELNKEFGGSAEAIGKTLPGRIKILKENLTNLAGYIVSKLVPAFEAALGIAQDFGKFIGKVFHAPSLKVALDISAVGIKNVAKQVTGALRDALLGSTELVSGGSTGFIKVFHDGLFQQIAKQDWSAIGKSLGKSIGSSITFTTEALNNMLGSILDWTKSHSSQIAEAGILIAGAIVMKITDPVFWAHHMDLLIGILLVAFRGSLVKAGARLAEIVSKHFAGPIAFAAMSGVARLPKLMGDAIAAGSAALITGFRLLFAAVTAPVAAEAGRLTTAIIRGLRLVAIVTAFRAAFDGIQGIVGKAVDQVVHEVRRIEHWLLVVIGYVKDLIGWFGKIHAPHIGLPNLPSLNPFKGDSGGGGGSGAAEGKSFNVGRQLWDEIGMGEKLGLRVTSGYRTGAGAITKHGTKSDHGYNPSRAVDMAGSAGGMAALFTALIGRKEIRQAFYDPLGSIFGGVRSSYREGGHSDHIHVAEYDNGGWLQPGLTMAYNGLGRPERVGGGDTYNVVFPNYVGNERELESAMQRIMTRYGKRNAMQLGDAHTSRNQFRTDFRGLQGA